MSLTITDPLYEIVYRLSDTEFDELHNSFMTTKADKSAAFLTLIRENPINPEKTFLKKFDITYSAFYVLKSRLNEKVQQYLLKRIGNSDLDIISRVLKANDTVFKDPRPLAIGALTGLEKELERLDFPFGLMIVYKLLQNLHCFDEDKYGFYGSQYNRQVAYTLAVDKANDIMSQFFKTLDLFILSRKADDHTRLMRLMEKIENLCNLYDSKRLYIYKAIIHLYGRLLLDLSQDLRCVVESAETLVEKSLFFLDQYKEDGTYQQVHLLFNYLVYSFHEAQNTEKSQRYFDVLDYKIPELLTGYHLNANFTQFLYSKIRYHIRNNTLQRLQIEVDKYLSNLDVDMYRPCNYIHYQLFLAITNFLNRNYSKSNRILYSLRNSMSFRKFPHVDLEIKFLLSIGYIVNGEEDLSNQLIMSIQRQLRNDNSGNYEHCKVLLKILTVSVGSRLNTRHRNLEKLLPQWKKENVGNFAILKDIDLENVFMNEME